jgi:hypothetical protein
MRQGAMPLKEIFGSRSDDPIELQRVLDNVFITAAQQHLPDVGPQWDRHDRTVDDVLAQLKAR